MDEQRLLVGGGQEVNSGHDGVCVCVYLCMCACAHMHREVMRRSYWHQIVKFCPSLIPASSI